MDRASEAHRAAETVDARRLPGRGDIPALRQFELRVVDDGPERFTIEMAAAPETHNAVGAVHGGVIATLIDHTGGMASAHLAGKGGPTADLHIRYLNAARGDYIRAEARILRAGGRLAVVAVEVTDSEGQVVAVGDMTVAVGTRRPGTEFPD